MRPSYETGHDLSNEEAVASYLATRRDPLNWRKLPISYRCDYVFADSTGKIRFFAEIKCRTCSSKAYSTYLIALGKWDALNALANGSAPVFLIVRWTDRLGSLRVRPITRDTDLRIGGRQDRNDSSDLEPVVHLPIRQFATP
jgi:hypothetical protein